jgi:hypothetical protein
VVVRNEVPFWVVDRRDIVRRAAVNIIIYCWCGVRLFSTIYSIERGGSNGGVERWIHYCRPSICEEVREELAMVIIQRN